MSKAPRQSTKAPPPNQPRAAVEGVRRAGSRMSPAETARVIAEFTTELGYLARQAKLDLLAYVLDMARLEAVRTLQASEDEG